MSMMYLPFLLCFSLFSLLFLYFTTNFRASARSQAASQACFAPQTRTTVPVVATLEIRSKKSSNNSSIRSFLIGAEYDEITSTTVEKDRQRSLSHFVSLAIPLLSR
jgi:hypothetical protein